METQILKTNRIVGSILGLALRDAFSAPYEGGMLERVVWGLIVTNKGKHRWTDGTQMTIDIIESTIEKNSIDQDDIANRFAKPYRWSRGYGPGAARLLKRIQKGQDWRIASRTIFRDGSFGNGGAMLSSVIGLFYATCSDTQISIAARHVA